MSERISFQADADLDAAIIKGVRRLQPAVDFLDPHQGGLIGLPDPDVLRKVALDGRILVTHDAKTMPAHFTDFLAGGDHSPGVFIIQQLTPLGEAIEVLFIVWEASTPEEWIDRLVYLP